MALSKQISSKTVNGEEVYDVPLPDASLVYHALLVTKRTNYVIFNFHKDGEASTTIRCKWNEPLGRYKQLDGTE